MSGEYIFAGQIVAKAIDSEGLPVTRCDNLLSVQVEVAEQVARILPSVFGQGEIGVWAFTHWH